MYKGEIFQMRTQLLPKYSPVPASIRPIMIFYGKFFFLLVNIIKEHGAQPLVTRCIQRTQEPANTKTNYYELEN